MSPSKPPAIAIIGGGPCGLTFARLLQTAGIKYHVFERDPSPESTSLNQGGTLDIHNETGQEALRHAGLHDKFKKLSRQDATAMTLMDSTGGIKASFSDDTDRPEIDRLQLRQLLLNSLPADSIRWGKTLSKVGRNEDEKRPGASSWVLNFADGSTETGFRLVVGADGAWSKVRQVVSHSMALHPYLLPIKELTLYLRSHLPSQYTRAKCLLRAVCPTTTQNMARRVKWQAKVLPWL